MELPGFNRLSTAIRTQRASRTYGIDALTKVLKVYLNDTQIAEVQRAAEFAELAHHGQFRKSGEPYFYHPLAVARTLAEMRMDPTTLIAAILHDVVEDTPTAVDEVAARFGPDVATLVDGVSKLSKAQFQSREEVQAASFRKLLMAMAEDIRVILVKLADRLHNMRTLDSVPDEKRKRVARETLEIYAPIAHRLGIHTLRVELEDLGFRYLYPNRYRVLSKAVEEVSGERRDLIREIEGRIRKTLKDEGITARVAGRQKNLYSIYLKMRNKHRRFLQVLDLFGFRVVVNQVDDCYRALGVVHYVYRPISDQFNDFIANPKSNGYQSLHTTLVGPKGVKIEVQIRTRDMHRIAESGVAAHWQYKQGETRAGTPHKRASEWLGNVLEMDNTDTDAQDFLESVKIDLFPDEVYVFTPKGDVRRLPRKSTPVDLAYAIHTDLGNSCVAARVDQHLVPLSTQLENGQTVEIITARHAVPNPAWLTFVRTAKARSSIRHHLKSQRVDQAEKLGQRLLNKSLRELGVPVRRQSKDRITHALEQMSEPSMEQLYISIGLGQRLAPLAARHFLDEKDRNSSRHRNVSIAVEGTEGLVVEYGRCCSPIPGDPIVGHVSKGRGVVIHRLGCSQITRRSGEEWIELRWSRRVKGDFHVELRVQTDNRRGVLGQLATIIADSGSNIENVALPEKDDEVAITRFRLTVSDRKHLAEVMRRLRRQTVVQKVTRT